MSTNSTEAVMGGGKAPRVTQWRLKIGVDYMNPFAGVSDGDLFAAKDTVYKLRSNGSGGWTLKPHDNILGQPLQGFEVIADYQHFLTLVNNAFVNGI